MLVQALLVSLAAIPAPVASFPQAAFQEPEAEPVDEREEIAVLVEQLGDHADQRGKQDQEAIAVIDALVQQYPSSGPKDRASIVKALDKCFKEKRPEEGEGRQNQLYLAAATALGEMTPESVDVLLSWIGHKDHDRDLALQRVLILEAGGSVTPEAQKELQKLLKHHRPAIQAAAAEGLACYAAADLEVRKEVFDELLKLLMEVKGQVDSDVNDTIARDRWDVISGPTITSLQKLSGHDERDPQQWLYWWNKNKKADWDA
jgi:hypothetical protein